MWYCNHLVKLVDYENSNFRETHSKELLQGSQELGNKVFPLIDRSQQNWKDRPGGVAMAGPEATCSQGLGERGPKFRTVRLAKKLKQHLFNKHLLWSLQTCSSPCQTGSTEVMGEGLWVGPGLVLGKQWRHL